ncbi:MAG: hypothetical protein Q9N68_13855 [Gammaproteobacteria bacterium]|nr:hypothetical protein [Gammaproteobacteria bacterium]
MSTLHTSLLAFALSLSSPILTAEVIDIPTRTVEETMPERGISMKTVREQLGEPMQIESAIGKPPITRWHYPQFTVYFERRFVIHAVKSR